MGVRTVDVVVTGRVQGVSYRARCAEQARSLGVRGWVRNEAGGEVAGHFEGEESAVEALLHWCAEGPRSARVDRVEVSSGEPTAADAFRIR